MPRFEEDNDLFITLQNAEYVFYFDVVCAQGSQGIVDGQTYTLSDMLTGYSFGKNLSTGGSISYASASLSKAADGSYTATVVDMSGNTYNITYLSFACN